MEWCHKYRQPGVEGLREQRGGPVRAKLSSSQVQDVADTWRVYRPRDVLGPDTQPASGEQWTIADLAQALAGWSGVSGPSRVS